MKLKKSLTIAVKNYLKEIDTLIKLVRIYGKKDIRSEINRLL